LVLGIAACLALEAQTAGRPQIAVSSCWDASGGGPAGVFGLGLRGDGQQEAILGVRFRNDSTVTLTHIVWRARFESGWIDFPDDGTFSPGIQIDRFLVISRHASGIWAGKRLFPYDSTSTDVPENCAVIATTDAGGGTWRDPSAPAAPWRLPPDFAHLAQMYPATLDTPTHQPIGIASCQYEIDGRFTDVRVRFTNLAAVASDSMRLRASYGTGAFAVDVRGDFEPRRLEDHRVRSTTPRAFPWRNVVTLDDPSKCELLSAHFVDGTIWQSPDATDPLPVTPTPAPNAVGYGAHRVTNAAAWLEPVPSPTP
jgi:hypothetical protein